MKKARRILAGIGAILLIAMYVMTLVFALIGSPFSRQLLMAAIACTIILPVLLYAFQLVYRVVKRNDPDEEDASDGSGSDDPSGSNGK